MFGRDDDCHGVNDEIMPYSGVFAFCVGLSICWLRLAGM